VSDEEVSCWEALEQLSDWQLLKWTVLHPVRWIVSTLHCLLPSSRCVWDWNKKLN